ncbi:MAG: PAAR domain-containing protein [Coxiellaceae bacterium]|nr:MAG: PAAR domain-containing protein [Coxiellaceae bacterium]
MPQDQTYALVGDQVLYPDGTTGIIIEGSPDVMIENKPVARQGDRVLHPGYGDDSIIEGCEYAIINGKPAAFQGARTAQGGTIAMTPPRKAYAFKQSNYQLPNYQFPLIDVYANSEK